MQLKFYLNEKNYKKLNNINKAKRNLIYFCEMNIYGIYYRQTQQKPLLRITLFRAKYKKLHVYLV